ncbi:MAG: hypothetical protein K5694_02555 [Bacilli bacterium]|nr:hypothetical protein [Bacilli bacterium]
MNKKLLKRIFFFIAGSSVTFASLGMATFAWFATTRTSRVTVNTIELAGANGVGFDFYYLRKFTDNETTKDGNYNSYVSKYSGYEKSYASATFQAVTLNESGTVDGADNPLAIDQLWPAHKLTYAMVITEGTPTKFTLDSWSENADEDIKINSSTTVKLSWAINMYGYAYAVTSTENVLTDIATAYQSYRIQEGLTDAFTSTAPAVPAQTATIFNSFPSFNPSLQRCVLFLTIEFSNDSGTFYTYNESTGYYEKDISGNSNCYETLSLSSLAFTVGA